MSESRWKRLLEAIKRIHGTSLAPESWPAALEAAAACVGGHKAVMFSVDRAQGNGSRPSRSVTIELVHLSALRVG